MVFIFENRENEKERVNEKKKDSKTKREKDRVTGQFGFQTGLFA